MATQFPPAGTKCQDCTCCLATIYAGNVPVCWECDEGVPCKGRKSAQAAPAPEVMVSVPKVLQRVERAAAAIESVERKQGLKAGSALGRIRKPAVAPDEQVSEALKLKILAADPGISDRQLGLRLGLRYETVRRVRKENGFVKARVPRQTRKETMPLVEPQKVIGVWDADLRKRFDQDEPVEDAVPTTPDWMLAGDEDQPETAAQPESRTDIPAATPAAPTTNFGATDYYDAVIAVMIQMAVLLHHDLQLIESALPVLRQLRDRNRNPGQPSTAPQQASPETARV